MWIMQPCPMHRELENVTYCLLEDEFEMILLISFFDPEELKGIKMEEFENASFCLNAVISDDEEHIFCPTKQQKIKVRDRPIHKKIYKNTREVLLFMDPDAMGCPECLYKAFVAMIKSVEEM
ncbi:MAG: hypothetical protein V3V41_03140 [Candidatus Heimdallarchaeota archaeon]